MARHFQYVGIQGPLAQQLSQVLAASIKNRIQRGLDVRDQAAPPLSEVYARLKARRGLNPYRDWQFSRRTLGALSALPGQDGTVRVGFSNATAGRIAAINNAYWRMFGVSPNDRRNLISAIRGFARSLVRAA